MKFQYISSTCIWYEGIRDGFNQVYANGEPKPLPLEDVSLLNEMCPNFVTREGLLNTLFAFHSICFSFSSHPGVSPNLCCDRKQIAEMQKFKYILDNVIGRCPSCYFNFLRIFCEMSCNPNHDQFIWPLEYADIVKPSEQETSIKDDDDEGIRNDWALADYVDPEDEQENQEKVTSKAIVKPLDTVRVITKIRYFISEQQANDFIASCW